MPTFTPYEKIRETLNDWFADDVAGYRAAGRMDWVVTEKIHGANFSWVVREDEVRCARRKGWIAEGEDFFGHLSLVSTLGPGVREVAKYLKSKAGVRADVVIVIGEIYGGKYPHPKVAPVPDVQPVQTGVWYCPQIEFCAFDIAVIQEGETVRRYLDFDTMVEACKRGKVPYSVPLFIGNYEEASAWPLGFETTIPALFRLPSLGPTNKAEGVVLKPRKEVPGLGGVRPVLKRKIAEFAEDERYHGAEKWEGKVDRGSYGKDGRVDLLKWEATSLVNENRLFAAVSKVGRVTQGDEARCPELIQLMEEDVWSDLTSRNAAVVAALSSAERAAVEAFLKGEIRTLVELYLPE
ncbi:MAG: RNA ligase [Polyangiaceae bacterium]|nr:RNA ligase [Polyangiaceae bacterium]